MNPDFPTKATVRGLKVPGPLRVSKKCHYFLGLGRKAFFKLMFRRGVYLAEHTLQAASVEFVPYRGTNYAHSRLPEFVGKARRGFSTV